MKREDEVTRHVSSTKTKPAPSSAEGSEPKSSKIDNENEEENICVDDDISASSPLQGTDSLYSSDDNSFDDGNDEGDSREIRDELISYENNCISTPQVAQLDIHCDKSNTLGHDSSESEVHLQTNTTSPTVALTTTDSSSPDAT